ncbi:sugar nucleotide-binding protein [Aliarcobacter skirrowii]|uniref:SDR family oxidoreductase n=1 Tax=Aliarcobacter skirrowii TaxID=28200 RepID=UPI0029AADE7B|nr:sugar nucleotide-binding protein [Aliarcobacter skirrowii]MDX3959082.1 sugar nucleotide-binding protein [Aliarcobacter skirrowii]
MKILIIGASSFIGFRLFKFFKENILYEVVGTYFQNKKDDSFLKCDITNKEDIKNILEVVQPDVILWVAGSKNLKECEASFDFAKMINTNPVQDCVDYLEKIEKKPHLIFFSTDYIFDGEKGNFSDLDTPNPKTNYGLSNYLSEKIIEASSIGYSIIRTSAVMGKGGTFFDWLLLSLKTEENLDMFSDIYFSPTPVKFLMENIANIVDRCLYGTFNICGSERLSRFTFASIVKTLNSEFKANLVASEGTNKTQIFQKDLSMIQSEIVINNKTLLEYLEEEI